MDGTFAAARTLKSAAPPSDRACAIHQIRSSANLNSIWGLRLIPLGVARCFDPRHFVCRSNEWLMGINLERDRRVLSHSYNKSRLLQRRVVCYNIYAYIGESKFIVALVHAHCAA